jgi:membrane associated rhomboid family serine protease
MQGSFSILGRTVPGATRALLGVVVVGSILDAIFSRWLGLFDAAALAALVPGRVLAGEVWRLVTYPWIAGNPLSLVFGALMLVFFAAPLEARWGTRRFLLRLAVLVAVPALVTVALGAMLTRVDGYPYAGLGPLGLALLTAFASAQRGARIALFPLPFVLEADQFLVLEGGLLLLYMLFAGTTVPFIPEVASFGLALAWFRLGLDLGLGRSWSRYQRARAEASLEKLRKKRGLRLVRDDDDEQRYLH